LCPSTKYRLDIMQKKIYVFVLLLILSSISFAQPYDNLWLLGGSSLDIPEDSTWGIAVLDFTENQLDIYYDGYITMDFQETNTSISDEEGNLLFYSNGIFIANAEHEVMENGGDLNEWNSQIMKTASLCFMDAGKILFLMR